jgi:integrase
LKHRTTYQDHGLVFAREVQHQRTAGLGSALTTFSESLFSTLIKKAGVKRITFHGLRHTCATLLIADGVPIPVVSERLGHTKVSMTANVYAHVLPGQQEMAAARIGALLHG